MITSLYAGILALLMVKISLDTIKIRQKYQISLGPGENNEVEQMASAHSNFSQYVPPLLILLYLLEQSQTVPVVLIHLIGISFTIGRYYHYIAFKGEKMWFKMRKRGMKLTLFPLIILGCLNIYAFIMNLI